MQYFFFRNPPKEKPKANPKSKGVSEAAKKSKKTLG